MINPPKLLLAGSWEWEIYEYALARGFHSNGWEVIPFRLGEHLGSSLFCRFQAKLKLGPEINGLNRKFLKVVSEEKPDAIFLNLVDLIFRETLEKVKHFSPDIVLVTYHNDNPFVGLKNRFKWRHYLSSIRLADITLVYRPSNIKDARRWGGKNIHILPPYYLTYRDRPCLNPCQRYSSDVIFIGHFEDDGRAETIDYLVNNGIDVGLYGTGWEKVAKRYSWAGGKKIRMTRGNEYSRLLSQAKIGLVFLSRANRDVWTRRCFEIPACGTLMMAPRTGELEDLFADGREAVYYDSEEDLLQKLKYYLVNDKERQQIAHAGRERCINDGHNQMGRTETLIRIIYEFAMSHQAQV